MHLYEKTAAELARMLKSGDCSSAEITESCLSRIDAVEDKLGAFITQTRDIAVQQARAIDDRRSSGEALPPLAGIPIGLKDNICTRGVTTTCASKMLEHFVPPYSATVADRLETAGTVMLGKLNLDEFAMGSSCETSYFGSCKNPHDLSRVPGGSSGGSAAAVAAGEVIASLGSDTGGSSRLPAAYCGVVGLKPTYGMVSRFGAVAFASSLDQIAPIARCAEDAAMLLDAICGHDPKDDTSARHAHPAFAANIGAGVKGMRIAIPKEYFSDGVDPQTADAVHAAAKILESEGAILSEISLPSTAHALSAYYVISSAEAASNLARFDGVRYGFRAEGVTDVDELYELSRTQGFGAEVKRRIMLGTNVLSSGFYADYYKRAKLLQMRIRNEFSAAFEGCDLLLTPTSPTTAIKLGENVGDPMKMYAMDICTVTVNIAGVPAISLPCGKDTAGLPIGMQLIAGAFQEQSLLAAAYSYERATGGPMALPSIS